MEYKNFASDLPRERTIAFTCAEENEETLRRLGVNQRMRQLGRGPFRAELASRTTESVEFYADRFSTACSMVLEPPAGTVGFLFLRSAAGRVLASGSPVAGDRLVVLPPGSGVDLTTPDLTGSEAFGIPVARFDETAETLCPTLGRVRPEGMTVLEGNPAQLQNLARAVLGLVAQDRDPESEEVSNLLANTILWMEGGSGESRPDGFPVARARRHVAKLAQEFIEERYRGTVRTEDLCRVTRVSARVLQRCFREYFDMTCTEYLKAVRLDAAFRALVAAYPANGTVTEVAVNHGFNHLGRFAVEFRQRFGQLPRDALAIQSGRT